MLHVTREIIAIAAKPANCLPTIIVCSIFGSLSWIAVCLRLWTRLSIVKNLGWDDMIMVVALVRLTHGPLPLFQLLTCTALFLGVLFLGHLHLNKGYGRRKDCVMGRVDDISHGRVDLWIMLLLVLIRRTAPYCRRSFLSSHPSSSQNLPRRVLSQDCRYQLAPKHHLHRCHCLHSLERGHVLVRNFPMWNL
jgi:hypothetical protein